MPKDVLTHQQLGDLLSWEVWLTPALLSALLILSSYSSFLLFHTLAELFAIMVGVMMFVVALYTHPYARNHFLFFLAIGFFWVAGLDLTHTLAFKGMAIYATDGANISIQLWIVARFIEAILLFSAPFFLIRQIHSAFTFVFFGLIAATFYLLIMHGYFPDTFIEGKGLTPFKIYSEYVICAILSLALVHLYIHRHDLKTGILPFLAAAIVLTICSELAFTLYTDVHDLPIFIGHIFKLFAFWLIFYSIVRLGLKAPYESLHESEERFNLAMRGANDGLWDWNLETDKVYYSPRWKDILGYAEDELGSMIDTWETLVHPDETTSVLAKVQDYLEGRTDSFAVEMRMRHKQGHWVNILSRAHLTRRSSDQKAVRLVGTHVDITERKHMDDQLRESEEYQRTLFEQSPIGLALSRMDGQLVDVNAAFANIIGYTVEETLNLTYWEITPEKYTDNEQQQLEMLEKTGHYGPYEKEYIHKDGHFVPVSLNGLILERENEHYIWSSVEDISERKEAERKTNMLLQAVQQAGEAVMITDRDAVIEYINPAFSEITGYSPEEVLGKTPEVLKSTAQEPAFYKELWNTITRGEVWQGKLIDKRKDGSFYPALMSISPIHNDGGEITHYVAIQQDMSDYKKMEDQFLQAQKMEAIGTLVGGIAHDFNNMLGAMQGNVYLARRKLEDQPEVEDRLDTIEQLGMRSAKMVKQLLTFARKDRMKMISFSLNAFIREGFNLGRAAIPENVELVFESCPEDMTIHGDATQLQQALMNLLNNARDAVAHVSQPRILCKLKPYTATADFLTAHPELKGEAFAVLTVRDNGDGIKKANLQKVFEPFFTTKGVGEGTGLGLAMVYGTVQSHGGALEVESKLGVGTAFHIYLPLTDEGRDTFQEKEKAVVQGRGETILIVDDEASMRSATSGVLESLGYKVLSAGDGEEALEIFRAHQKDIRLVLTDIVMPKMGGVDLARSIRLLVKKMPIIFVTGYDKDQAMSAEDRIEQSSIIMKPCPPAELSQCIRRLIRPLRNNPE